MARKDLQERVVRNRDWNAIPPLVRRWFGWLSMGYGEQPLQVVFWILVLAFGIFPLLYWGLDAIQGESGIQSFDYLWFSLRSTVTVAYADLQPSGAAGNTLVFFQGALGVGGFAMFIYTLGRKVAGY